MRVISIANQKGGCGKTTTAINLSSFLAEFGRKVLVIDLDPQAHASYGFGVNSQNLDKSIYNTLTDVPEKRRNLGDVIVHLKANLDLAPSNILLSTLEQELKDKEDAVSKLHLVFAQNTLDYSYIIIDCPPSLGFLTFNALRASDEVIVPIEMSAFSLMGVSKLLGMLELIKIKISHTPRVKALATIYDKRTNFSDVMMGEIKRFFNEDLYKTTIRINVALKKAIYKRVPIDQFDKDAAGAKDYCGLAKEVIDEEKLVSPYREADFTFEAPEAKEVYIAGDFNGWRIEETGRLLRTDDGRWKKRLALAPGKYRYKFYVDGQWVLDSGNRERESNPFGSLDSILKLGEDARN